MLVKLPRDLIIQILPLELRSAPSRVASIYAVLALSTSLFASLVEGVFITEGTVTWRGQVYPIHPLIYNFSTLLDFAVFNPLIIYFVLRSRLATRAILGNGGRASQNKKPTSLIQPILYVILSIAVMYFYHKGFLHGDHLDAVVTVAADGSRLITVTGWIVYTWTVLAIYYIFLGIATQLSYYLYIRSLDIEDFGYEPTHPDGVAGLRVYAEPSLYFLKFTMVVLLIFLVFTVYDFVVFNITESNRVWCLPLYLLIVVPLFTAPLLRLHSSMRIKRNELLHKTMLPAATTSLLPTANKKTQGKTRPYTDVAKELEALDCVRQWVLKQPTWPLPVRTLASAAAYLSGIALPLVPKLLGVLLASFGVEWNPE